MSGKQAGAPGTPAGAAALGRPPRGGGELDAAMLGRFTCLLRTTRPEGVHVHSRRDADWWGGLAARRAGVPALVSRRVVSPEPAWIARYEYRLYRAVIA